MWEGGRYTLFTSSSAVFSTEYHEEIMRFSETQGIEKIPNTSFWFQLYTIICLSKSSSDLSKSFRNDILQILIPLKRQPQSASLPCFYGRQKAKTTSWDKNNSLETAMKVRKQKVTTTVLVLKACKRFTCKNIQHRPQLTVANGFPTALCFCSTQSHVLPPKRDSLLLPLPTNDMNSYRIKT